LRNRHVLFLYFLFLGPLKTLRTRRTIYCTIFQLLLD
jgi:hypothetical protein